MNTVSHNIVLKEENPYWRSKDIARVFGVAMSTAYKYLKEFFQLVHEKHIYPMDCAFEFFDKKVVNKYAFYHYYQYRNQIINGLMYEKFDEEKFVRKLRKSEIKLNKLKQGEFVNV